MTFTREQARQAAKNWPAFAVALESAEVQGDQVYVLLPTTQDASIECLSSGPGTELKRLLASAGILPNGCQCDARAALMDANGLEWCKANISTIVGWLAAEAQARGIPFPKVGIWLLVQAAIAAARKTCFDTAKIAE